MATDGFKKGTGAYTCVDCGKLTRKVKYQDSDEMCMLCEQKSYLQVMIDDGEDEDSIRGQRKYIEKLEAQK